MAPSRDDQPIPLQFVISSSSEKKGRREKEKKKKKRGKEEMRKKEASKAELILMVSPAQRPLSCPALRVEAQMKK